MEVTISHVTNNGPHQTVVHDVLLGLDHQGGQGGDGDTDVGGDGPAPGHQVDVGVVALVPRRPQHRPLLRLQRELELSTAVVCRNSLYCLSLTCNLGLGSMKF